MSMKDRLSKKTEGLLVPTKKVEGAAGAPPLRTGPGQMLMVNSLMKENNEKVAQLEERLKQFEGVLPVKLIDPALIVQSKWANRTQQNFESAEFKQLVEEIREAGGNVQPIKVRPVDGQQDAYEIVFGHRRHRACQELGLPVLAMVEEVSDVSLFKEMDRENRTRLDLSPWEQGMMYRRALQEKLFTSQEQMARELGVDAGNLSKALRLADLDQRLIEAFSSPLDLQYRWAKPLSDAMRNDAEGVLERAAQLKNDRSIASTPKQVVEFLLGTGSKETGKSVSSVTATGSVSLVQDGDRVTLQFDKGFLNDARLAELRSWIEEWMKR
ncbi:ParB/RepB/Spo0J family partition protein [Noviherbaspirillum massiliense]|uniref:ParB/RepB/Spo0J family partition protein n=1 Tax=Noviherbaspirillum massiliense TaxID=1465823 RepID=UPI0002DC2E76|nr:ParB/RepB/Spo0J family partition protein [Noviherbaspirillum massiliense]